MRCVECIGTVDLERQIIVATGCRSSAVTFACNKCGRLHWQKGEPLFNRSGKRAFIDHETGELYNKPALAKPMKRPKKKKQK